MFGREGREGAIVLAALLIAGGVLLLVARMVDWRIGDHFWPFFVILPGLALVAIAVSRPGQGARVLASGGAVVIGTGVILLFQSLTDYYQSWAYAWALLPVFSGIALIYIGRRDDDARSVDTGVGMVKWGGVMFAGFAIAFEGLIFNHFLSWGGFALPLALIGIGIAVLLVYMRTPPAHDGPDAHHDGDSSAKPPTV